MSFDTCDNGHPEIVYLHQWNKGCPLCEANETIEELEKEIAELQEQNEQSE